MGRNHLVRLTEVYAAVVVLGVLVVAAAGCAGRDAGVSGPRAPRTVIQNIGSDTMVNVAQAWAEEYVHVEPGVSVEVSGGGSGTGIAALINGSADIANCSRRMEPSEIDRATERGGVPHESVVGYDALAVFVHAANPLDEITIAQIAQIYGEHGTIERWTDLGVEVPGCASNRIIRISRQSNSGTYAYFREAVLGKKGDFKLGSLDLHGSKDVVEVVARTPCAVGYSGMGYATGHVKMLRVAVREGEPAFAPTVETTQTGEYPIARPLLMYWRGEATPAVQRFLDWVHTEAGQRIVAESGYVPLVPTEATGDTPPAG